MKDFWTRIKRFTPHRHGPPAEDVTDAESDVSARTGNEVESPNDAYAPLAHSERLMPPDPDELFYELPAPTDPIMEAEMDQTSEAQAVSSSVPDPVPHEDLVRLGTELVNVAKLATSLTAQWPGYLLFGVGLLLVLVPLASKFARFAGIGIGEFEAIEFVAAIAAGAILFVAGTVLHNSDNAFKEKIGTQAMENSSAVTTEAMHFASRSSDQ
jgi:hypothetical protein